MSTSRPSAGQALLIALSAVALLVTACFGALGVGATFTSGVLPAVGGLALTLVAALGLTGFIVGVARFIGAITRTVRPAGGVPEPPSTDGAATASAQALSPAGRRPSFGQALAIFAAGLVVFSGACIGLVDGGRRQSDASAALWTLLLAAATAAAVWGFSSMVWGRRPAGPAAAAPPSAPLPPEPTPPAGGPRP